MKLNATEKNVRDAVKYMLSAMKIKVSSTGLEDDLILHPNFPSLVAISDAFFEWGIPNLATRLSVDQLKAMPFPALVYLNRRGGIFAPIMSVTDNNIEWLDTKEGWQKSSFETFSQYWDGTCLLMEPLGHTGEASYKESLALERRQMAKSIFLMTAVGIILTIILINRWQDLTSAGGYYLFTLVLKFAGTLTSGLILWQSLDSDNSFLQSLCQVGGNCKSILQSPGAKITSWLSWSEVGLCYFFAGFGSLLFVSQSDQNALWSIFALLSLTAIPYTLYSFWYQHFVALQWCVLCNVVQVILLVEVSVVLFHSEAINWSVSGYLLILIMLCFLVPALIWTLVKGPLSDAGQLFELRRELNRIKFNENYIQVLFSTKPEMPPIFNEMHTVKLGNPSAEDVLTIITNPLCGPCATRHNEIEELLKTNSHIRCEFVFLGNSDAQRVASVFLSTANNEVGDMMHSWYNNPYQNVGVWLKHQKRVESEFNLKSQLELHARWSQLADVMATPTLFINGVKLTQAFQLRDIKHLGRVLKDIRSKMVVSNHGFSKVS